MMYFDRPRASHLYHTIVYYPCFPNYPVDLLIRVNLGSIFGWGLIFIFGGLVNFIFKF